jgi:hypothetical protein
MADETEQVVETPEPAAEDTTPVVEETPAPEAKPEVKADEAEATLDEVSQILAESDARAAKAEEQEEEPEPEEKTDPVEPDDEKEEEPENGEPVDGSREPDDEEEEEPILAIRLIDPDLLNRALTLGITMNDARSFTDDASLEKAVSLVEGRLSSTQAGEPAKAGPGAAPSLDGKAAEATGFTFDWTHAEDPEFVPEDIHPVIRRNLEQLADHQSKAIAAMTNQVQVLIEGHKQQQRKDTVKRLDSMFEELPAEYKRFVGKGSMQELGSSSKEGQIRGQITSIMAALYPQADDETQAFKMAVHAVLGDEAQELARQKLAKRVEKHSKRKTSRPAKRKTPPTAKDSDRELIAEVKKMVPGL